MTRIHWPLLSWQFGQTLPVTLIALPLAMVYVVLREEPFEFRVDQVPALFVLLHSLAIVWSLGRVRSVGFGYLYTQGYSRGALWGHMMLASLAAVMAVWLPVAASIWLPIRSAFQDVVLRNPYAPFMSPAERAFTLWWLWVYSVLVPLFHYAWVRSSAALRGLVSGHILAFATVAAQFTVWLSLPRGWQAGWIRASLASAFLAAAIVLMVGGYRLHSRMEVRG
jgi:hypothetical protein